MSSKQKKIEAFDPNGMAQNTELFGLPFEEHEAQIIVLPVPWEVTVSYESGTASGPSAVRKASWQVDVLDPYIVDAWKMGIYMPMPAPKLWNKSDKYRKRVEAYLELLTEYPSDKTIQTERVKINEACAEMISWVQKKTEKHLKRGQRVILLGGDHSTSLGYIKALEKTEEPFGLLQIDAHADLRKAYEGLEFSHASIMYNVLETTKVTQLVQVGVRDYCEEELAYINRHPKRIQTYFDRDLKHAQYKGTTWAEQVNSIVDSCPQRIYVSFDIDGLSPQYCPNTGTPVPGGFSPDQILFLLEKLVESGKTIIGMDLNEVAPGESEWDANVASRLLFRMCNLLGKSSGFL